MSESQYTVRRRRTVPYTNRPVNDVPRRVAGAPSGSAVVTLSDTRSQMPRIALTLLCASYVRLVYDCSRMLRTGAKGALPRRYRRVAQRCRRRRLSSDAVSAHSEARLGASTSVRAPPGRQAAAASRRRSRIARANITWRAALSGARDLDLSLRRRTASSTTAVSAATRTVSSADAKAGAGGRVRRMRPPSSAARPVARPRRGRGASAAAG